MDGVPSIAGARMLPREHPLCDRVRRLRLAQQAADDPFVRKVLQLAVEALEEAINVESEEEDDLPH